MAGASAGAKGFMFFICNMELTNEGQGMSEKHNSLLVCVLYKIKPLERVFLPIFRHQGVVTVKALVSDRFEIHKSGRN